MRLLVLFAFTLDAADWLNEGGTRNVQPLERELIPASVPGLKLLWKLRLGEGAALSSPIIMGRLITYRGTLELIFVASSDGHVYAVDGDFGKLFWTRKLDFTATKCVVPATPALTPNPTGADPDDDGEQPPRPLYVQAPDAMVHSLNPINGKDGAPAKATSCAAAWVVKNGTAKPLKPNRHAVIAGAVAFTLAQETGELQAFNALTKKTLFKSGPSSPTKSAIAIANGHVCFTAATDLYCYGFPLEH